MPVWVGGAGRAAIRRAARWGDAWHPINPDLVWLLDTGLPALRDEAAAAQRPTPQLVVRIGARLESWQAAGERPLGVGSVEQIIDDIGALARVGAIEVILDPNPDLPRPRDFVARTAAASGDQTGVSQLDPRAHDLTAATALCAVRGPARRRRLFERNGASSQPPEIGPGQVRTGNAGARAMG